MKPEASPEMTRVYRLTEREELDFDFTASQGEPETLRLWMSDRQWLALLHRIELGNSDGFAGGGSAAATGDREHARVAGNFRCMIRLGSPENPEDDHGVYTVRTRNVGAGGLGFVHGQRLHSGTRCTVALQPSEGPGLVVAGRVAWCREVVREGEDPSCYQVGVQFDRPLEIESFMTAA
jgi:hypothetical protein